MNIMIRVYVENPKHTENLHLCVRACMAVCVVVVVVGCMCVEHTL